MSITSPEYRRRVEALDPQGLADLQLAKLNDQLAKILPSNQFYAEKFSGFELPLASLEQLSDLPYTTKEELLVGGGSQTQPANLSYPLERYVHYHQTSGTHGRPLAVYDTADDWQWWSNCWQHVLDAADVTAEDRAFLAFSFGPFIGFWSAQTALAERGALVVPGGGLKSVARLNLMERAATTTLLCTPTYALHLVEVAQQQKINLANFQVRKIIVAGEPGGSTPAICERIESAWNARVTDHAGSSEVGPWGYGDSQQQGLHVLESEFIAEFIAVDGGGAARSGELAHLILTSLGRSGMPVIRYRTGDLVQPTWPTEGTNRFVLLCGGVLGRADDMMVVRGVNVFPSSIEQILRSFPEVVEYRMTARKRGEMDELIVEVEDHLQQPDRISKELQLRLGLRVEVRIAPAMSLPRFEGKGRRFIDQRDQ